MRKQTQLAALIAVAAATFASTVAILWALYLCALAVARFLIFIVYATLTY